MGRRAFEGAGKCIAGRGRAETHIRARLRHRSIHTPQEVLRNDAR